MCGIAGLIAKNKLEPEQVERFKKSCNLMQHRGPDYTGIFQDDKVFLLHHRLSIIDLDARSHQPFHTASGKTWVTFNGEIYNYRELISRYQISTRTSSDTEVLAEMYERLGVEAFKEWNGIFAAGLYTAGKNITLIRDRFGVKPLYYFENQDYIAFASEAKVILDWLPSFKINQTGLTQYLWYGNTTGSSTIIQGLQKVLPAQTLEIDLHNHSTILKNTFWDIHSVKPEEKIQEKEAVNQITDLLGKAVKRQMVADVPLGILLSGGIDSSAITAFASQYSSQSLDTYTVSYDYNLGGKSEIENARMVAKKFNTNHHELVVKVSKLEEIFEQLVFQYDEPFADPAAIPMYFLGKICSADKRVILQGDGGDELFGGYPLFNTLYNRSFWKRATAFYHFMPDNRLKDRLKRMNFVLNQKQEALMHAYLMTEVVPYKNPYEILQADWQKSAQSSNWTVDYEKAYHSCANMPALQRQRIINIQSELPNTFLEKVDKATMLHSVESRVPFLDNELAEFVLGLPHTRWLKGGKLKYLLKQSLKGVVPDEILLGKKRGFDVPYRYWLKNDLYGYAHNIFKHADIPWIDSQHCLELLEKNKNSAIDYSPTLWKSLVLNTWLTRYKNKIIE